jgi:hypothetical protein
MFSQRVSILDVQEAARLQNDRRNAITVMLYRGDTPAVKVVLSNLNVTDVGCMVEVLYHGDHVQYPAEQVTLVKNGSMWHLVVAEGVTPTVSYYKRTDVTEHDRVYGKHKVLKPRAVGGRVCHDPKAS